MVLGLVATTVLLLAAAVAVRLIGARRQGEEAPTDAEPPSTVTHAHAVPVAPPGAEALRGQPPDAETAYSPPPSSPALAAFVNREARTKRVTPDFSARFPQVTRQEDVDAVVAVLRDTKDSDTVRNEAANLLARSGYDGLVDDLIQILQRPEEGARFRAFCVQHLWTNHAASPPAVHRRIVEVLRERLDDPDLAVRREALLALVRLDQPEGRQTAVAWLTDPERKAERDLAVRCMGLLDARERAADIRPHVGSDDPVLRIAAISVLGKWSDQASRPALEQAAESTHIRTRRAARLALKRLDQASPAR